MYIQLVLLMAELASLHTCVKRTCILLCKSVYYYNAISVTGEANFLMETSLTVGGFNQPAVARTLIELPGNAEKGLSQRFLWLYPKPIYGKFKTLEPVREEYIETIGEYCMHISPDLYLSVHTHMA